MPAIAATAIDSRAFRVIVSSQRAHTTFTRDRWLGSQHGIHLLGLDRFLVFNNSSRILAETMGTAGGGGSGSIAAEYELASQGSMATIGYIEKRASLYGPPPH